MTIWKTLTEAELTPYLNSSQRDAIAARPDIGEDNDPLTVSISAITERIRGEIRANEKNVLSDDASLIPPELLLGGVYLVIEILVETIPGFVMTDAQSAFSSTAKSLLNRVSMGVLPVLLPGDPEAVPQVRTSFGPQVLSCRENRITAGRLCGL